MLDEKKRKAALRSAILKIVTEVDLIGAREFGRLNEAEMREWTTYISFLRALDASENKDKSKNS